MLCNKANQALHVSNYANNNTLYHSALYYELWYCILGEFYSQFQNF